MAKKSGNEELKKLFNDMDKDKSGCLSEAELKEVLTKGGRHISDSQFEEMFCFFEGPNGDRKISYEEFEKALDIFFDHVEEMQRIFNEHDVDRSGFLDKSEVKKVLIEGKFTDAEIDKFFRETETSGDGRISFEEFMNACT